MGTLFIGEVERVFAVVLVLVVAVQVVVFVDGQVVVQAFQGFGFLLEQVVQDDRLGEEEDREADGSDDW